MKIKLLSDLHHEWMKKPKIRAQNYFQNNGEDVLVLAGDIASGSTNVMNSIKLFKNAGWEKIIYVAGNHEYYGNNMIGFNSGLASKLEGVDNVHFLNPGKVVIGDTTFIGGTLWTNFRNSPGAAISAQRGIADFRLIDKFQPSHAMNLFQRDFGFIKYAYEERTTEKVVIVTHFLPAVECISPRFRDPTNDLNAYFANDLGGWIETLDNTTWLFGHTHDTIDITIGSTRLVSNPYGYWGQEVNQEFKPDFIVEL